MAFRKIFRKDLLAFCAEPGADDGRVPRLDRRGGPGRVLNRKALQLCAQAARTLAGVLAECGDAVLRELAVESVVPAPNTSRLLVTLSRRDPIEPDDVLARLHAAHGKLRGEVAAAVRRRRAPDLVFHVVGPVG